ncbi:MAG TPA: hypothetical protein VJM33_19220 [Microthrixaceae bacterium]|nr:hypothetical protein [Microthrixaceae bacterium]
MTLSATDPDSPADADARSRRDRRAARERRHRRVLIGVGLLSAAGLVAAAGWVATGGPLAEEPPVAVADDESSAPSVPKGLIGVGSSAPEGPATEIDNRIFVVGDSVVQAASQHLATELPDWSLIVDTQVGRFTGAGVEVATDYAADDDIGDIAVVGLGNNYLGDEAEFAAQVEEMMTALAGVDHVLWLTVAEYEDDQHEVNEVLRAAQAHHPNLVLVDWNSWWDSEPDFTGADQLHLTPEGAEAMAALIGDAVDEVVSAANLRPAPDPKDPILHNFDAGSPKSGKTSRSSRSSSKSSSSRSSSGSSSGSQRSGSPSRTATKKSTTTAAPKPATTSPPVAEAPAPTVPATSAPATSAAPPTTSPAPPTSVTP